MTGSDEALRRAGRLGLSARPPPQEEARMHRQTRTARLWTAVRRALAAYWTAVRATPTDAELAEHQTW